MGRRSLGIVRCWGMIRSIPPWDEGRWAYSGYWFLVRGGGGCISWRFGYLFFIERGTFLAAVRRQPLWNGESAGDGKGSRAGG